MLTEAAAINDNAPAAYRGLDRFAARQRIVDDLNALGLLAEVQAHRLMAPRGDRSGAVIEPRLTNQWFVKIATLAAPAIRAVQDGRIEFVPKGYETPTSLGCGTFRIGASAASSGGGTAFRLGTAWTGPSMLAETRRMPAAERG